VAEGKSNQEIFRQLYVSLKTLMKGVQVVRVTSIADKRSPAWFTNRFLSRSLTSY